MAETGREGSVSDEKGTPIRERVRTAQKIFSVEVRQNKNSRYITLPKSFVKQFSIEPGDQIELAFLGFELIAAEEKEDAIKRKKQKMTVFSS